METRGLTARWPRAKYAGADAVHELADWLDGRLATFAGTHCTGFEAQAILTERLPDAFEPAGVGTTIEIGE